MKGLELNIQGRNTHSDDAPDHDNPRIQELLATSLPGQESSSDPKHDQEDDAMADERTAHPTKKLAERA